MLFSGEGLHQGTYFYHTNDGFYYHVSEVRTYVIYFKCIKYGRGCLGRAILRSSGCFCHSQEHNHPRDYLYLQEMELRNRILRRAASREMLSFRDIINRERMQYGPAVACRMTSRRLRSQMYYRRMSVYPPVPHTIRDLIVVLQGPHNNYITASIDSTDNLFGSFVIDTLGQYHVLFVSRRILHFMSQCRVLFSDGTFKSTPNVTEINQVFCITTIWRHHVLPLAWILMSSKTEAAYTAVLQRLLNLLGTNRLRKVVTDFEMAEQNAWRAVFNVDVQGCLFHYVWNVLKYAFSLGLKTPLRFNEDLKRIVSWCCVLPLLPDELMFIGFHVIGIDTYLHYRELYLVLRPFFMYLNDTWLLHPVRRQGLSVSGSQHRTNNACETQNRWLLEEMGTAHPNVYVFISGISRIEQSTVTDIMTLREGGNPSRRRRAVYVAVDQRIISLTEDLRNPHDGIVEAVRRFLHAASSQIGSLVNQTIGDENNIAD